jgi:hypothetical protein
MGASPEMFRGVDGSRIAAVSVFFQALRSSRQFVRLNLRFSSSCADRFGFR